MSAWEMEVRSKKTARFAVGIAAVFVLVFVVLAVLLRGSQTGVYFRFVDQLSMAGIGVALAGGTLILTRPRLRVNAEGVGVRNAITERFVEWDLVQGLSFPDGAAWARIDLPDDEYIPVLAIQANDREHAVDAVRRFRALEAKYAPVQTNQGSPGA
ncbi:PH domain-containing protein [Rhodococcus tukisamuensis]|uniref:PH domain-containing protein n=1 Tax=Rhodococcus tukisamuensis TaxID=168276 RepID=A0A1G6QC99_9NOCA|nr:PH domain-containing protein [Rhodococcus tukisamuensis]SDC90120.1 PH domain-containing protein [Rhodococcus tukisamuensis]